MREKKKGDKREEKGRKKEKKGRKKKEKYLPGTVLRYTAIGMRNTRERHCTAAIGMQYIPKKKKERERIRILQTSEYTYTYFFRPAAGLATLLMGDYFGAGL